jgi:hypothetical protein
MSMKTKNKLETLIASIPSYGELSSGDIKALTINFILDQEDIGTDDAEKNKATRSRLKLEALRLLHDINKSENGGDIDSAILAVIAGKKE